jgi:4a-hydroxytetrahydrobiopterin dehydratase
MKVYEPSEISHKLETMEGWDLKNEAIEKQFKFKDFKSALAFIVKLGLYAEQADHHPEIFNVYNRVTIRLNTHSAKGITIKDFNLAEQIDSCV